MKQGIRAMEGVLSVLNVSINDLLWKRMIVLGCHI